MIAKTGLGKVVIAALAACLMVGTTAALVQAKKPDKDTKKSKNYKIKEPSTVVAGGQVVVHLKISNLVPAFESMTTKATAKKVVDTAIGKFDPTKKAQESFIEEGYDCTGKLLTKPLTGRNLPASYKCHFQAADTATGINMKFKINYVNP